MKSNCMECVHRNVCLRGKVSRILFCENYDFARSDAMLCERCGNRHDCYATDMSLFVCSHFWDRRTITTKEAEQ